MAQIVKDSISSAAPAVEAGLGGEHSTSASSASAQSAQAALKAEPSVSSQGAARASAQSAQAALKVEPSVSSQGAARATASAAQGSAAKTGYMLTSKKGTAGADTLRMDSAGADSAVADSMAADTLPHDTLYYLMLERPDNPALTPRVEQTGLSAGLSWIMGGLLLLFVIIAVRFHNNSKYLGAMFKSAFEVRERGNVFDDTVRETSFVILLNLMWSVCVGILLYLLVGGSMSAPDAAQGMAISVGLAVAYELFITGAYWMVGNVFSDRLHTRMWLRGFLSATGLTTLVLFPIALMALCYPANALIALEIGIIAVVLGKIIFICKGFRIFFNQIGSWVLFLYYLCSLEIVPLVLLYAGVAYLA